MDQRRRKRAATPGRAIVSLANRRFRRRTLIRHFGAFAPQDAPGGLTLALGVVRKISAQFITAINARRYVVCVCRRAGVDRQEQTECGDAEAHRALSLALRKRYNRPCRPTTIYPSAP